MTETEIETVPTTTTTDDWDAQFAALQTRFPKVRDTILFAFYVLQSEPDTSLDVLRAMARPHDLRVTKATVNAARRLFDRNPATGGGRAGPAPKTVAAKPRRTRQRRAPQAPLDVDALIRNTVAKVQPQGTADADRLRDAIRQAIAVLETAVG